MFKEYFLKLSTLTIIILLISCRGTTTPIPDTETYQNYAMQFDGIDDYINIPDSKSLRIEDEITLETWMNFEEGGTMQPRLISKGADYGNGYEFLTTDTCCTRNLEFRLGPGGIEISIKSKFHLNAGEWYHCAVSYDGSRIDMYINGELDSSKFANGSLIATSDDLCLGQKSLWDWDRYKGLIDDVRIWNIARTQIEIKQTMYGELSGNESGLVGYWTLNETKGDTVYDKTVNANHGTLHGGIKCVKFSVKILK